MQPTKRHSKRWWIFAALYTVINVGGALYAAAMGEMMHAGAHVVLMFAAVVGYLIWSMRRAEERQQELPVADPASEILDRLQQSVDAIALEVERVGESQRFNAKLLEKRTPVSEPKA